MPTRKTVKPAGKFLFKAGDWDVYLRNVGGEPDAIYLNLTVYRQRGTPMKRPRYVPKLGLRKLNERTKMSISWGPDGLVKCRDLTWLKKYKPKIVTKLTEFLTAIETIDSQRSRAFPP